MKKLTVIFLLTITSISVKAQVSVEWTALVGVDNNVTNQTLTKTASNGWNNAGARSENRLDANEDGKITYTITEITTRKAIGLSTKNSDQKFKSIDYAMVFNKQKLFIWEKGKFKGRYANFQVGDVFTVERQGSKIKYKKNGNQFRQRNTNANHKLFVDIAIHTTGTVISGLTTNFYPPIKITKTKQDVTCIAASSGSIDVTVTGGKPPYTYSWDNGAITADLNNLDIGKYTLTVTDANNKTKTKKVNILSELAWNNLEGLTANNGDLTKTGSNGWATGRAYSHNKLASNEDGFVHYKVDETNTIKILALSEETGTGNLQSLNHVLFIFRDYLFIFENGSFKGYFGRISIGDKLTIKRKGTKIKYRKNDQLLKKTTIDPSKELVVKVALYDQGATFNGVKTNFCNVPFIVDVTTTLEGQFTLGSITLNPQFGALPYTYVWDDDATITTQNRTDLSSGIYNVTVTDANSQIVQLKIVVGMELEFANIIGLDVINNEELLKTAAEGYGNAMTTLNNAVDGDGEVRIEIAALNQEFTFGLREETEAQATDHTNLNYGLFVDAQNNLNSWDKETQVLTNLGTVAIGDVISIEKIGQNLFYKQNDVIVGEGFIALAVDTIIRDSILPNDTANTQSGLVIGIDEGTNTATIQSLADGTILTCTEPMSVLTVVGSTVSYEEGATASIATNVGFPVNMPALGADMEAGTITPTDPRLCTDPRAAAIPVFKIDFSLFTAQTSIRKIKIIRFRAFPRIKETIAHAVCNIPNSAAISTTIRGGVAPFTYSWTGPNGFTATTADIIDLETGIYTLTVTDSWTTPHVVTETYHVGYSVRITNTKGATNKTVNAGELTEGLSRGELDKGTGANETTIGTAESQNQLLPNTDGGVAYKVDQIGFTKAFGLSERENAQTPDLPVGNYGIQLVEDGSIRISESGVIAIGNFGTYKLGDVIKVKRIGNQIFYTNNDVVLRSTTTDPTKKLIARFVLTDVCATLNNLYTDFCDLSFIVDLVTTDVSLEGLGIAELSLTNIPQNVVLSYCIYNELDSLIGTTDTTFIDGLDIGDYTIVVKDTITTDTLAINSFEIGEQLIWEVQNGITIVNGIAIKTGIESWNDGVLQSFNTIELDSDGSISFEILDVSTTAAIGFSFANITDENGFTGLKYGFFIENGQLDIYENGVLVANDIETYTDKDILEIEKIGNQIFYRKNGDILRTGTFTNTQVLDVHVGIFSSAGLISVRPFKPKKTRFFPTLFANVINVNCEDPVAGSIQIITSGGATFTNWNYSFTNEQTGIVEQNSSASVFTSAPIGCYTVNITANLGNSPLQLNKNLYMCVGNKLIYTNKINTQVTGERISKISGNNIPLGTFFSENKLESNASGWLCLNIKPKSINSQNSLLTIGLSPSNNGGSVEYGFLLRRINFGSSSISFLSILHNGVNAQDPFGNDIIQIFKFGDRLKVEREVINATTVEFHYYINNQIIFTGTSNNPSQELFGSGLFFAQNNFVSDFFEDVTTSFCPPITFCDVVLDNSNNIFSSITTDASGNSVYQLAAGYCSGDIIPISVIPSVGFNVNDYQFSWIQSQPMPTPIPPNFNCTNPNECSNIIIVPNANGSYEFIVDITVYNGSDILKECPLNIVQLSVDCNPPPPDPNEIIGCIFGNFGAGVFVGPNVNLNVYCNLLNELGGITSQTIEQGQFVNIGDINVKLDWINNGQNELFINNAAALPFSVKSGRADFFGDNQKLRGNSSTNFYNLELGEDLWSGNGDKTMEIDQYVYNTMDMQNSELVATDYVMFVENDNINSIYRGNGPVVTPPETGGNGYVSTDGDGYLSRSVNSADDYFFPMGSKNGTTRYRPVNVESSVADKYRVNYQNHDPFNDALTVLSPSVLSINDKFYHKINNTTGGSTGAKIQSYFSPGDGVFQAVSHWDNANPWWGSTFGQLSSITTTGTGPFDNGLFYAEIDGVQSFNDEPYVLANAGFVIGTPNWPNTGGTTGSSNGCVASFTSIDYNGQVVFTNGSNVSNSATYAWDFGDGNNSTQQHPTHIYSATGTYIVQLSVTDGTLSCSVTGTITILNVGGSPSGTSGGSTGGTSNACTASFTSVNFDPQVTFLNTSTGLTPSAIYAWNFGDGNSSIGLTASHIYTATGTYPVVLTITDGANICTATESIVITVAGGVPTGTSGGSTPNGCVATFVYTNYDPQVVLTSTAVVSNNATYLWTLGDGNTGTGSVFTHTYLTNGTYTVQLDIVDGTNTCSATAIITIINAGGSPVGTPGGSTGSTGNCTASFTSVNYDPQVTVTNTSTGINFPVYSWDFGDGNFATGPVASHTYANNGSFTISLTVTDGTIPTPSISCTATEQITIANNSGIVIVINPDNTGGNGGGTGGNTGGPGGTGPGSGPGGNNTSTPNTVPGDYIATIITNDACRLDGEIYFTILGNLSLGTIEYSTDLGVTRFTLSEEIYTETIGVPGFTIVATPEDLLQSCINSTTVGMGTGTDYILTWDGINATEDIIINSPFQVLAFRTDVSGSMVLVTTPPNNGTVTLPTSGTLGITNEGSYKFEMDIDINGITETVKGQFIAKQ